MLTDHEKAAALEIVLVAKDPEDFPIINARLCREFPNIQTDDLVALWREAGERQLAEGDALEAWAHGGWRNARLSSRAPLPPRKRKGCDMTSAITINDRWYVTKL